MVDITDNERNWKPDDTIFQEEGIKLKTDWANSIHLLGRQLLCGLGMICATILALNGIVLTWELVTIFLGPSGMYFYMRHVKDLQK